MEHGRTKAAADALDEVVPEASEVTTKVEKALELFNALAQHRIEPEQLSAEIDTLLDELERLDRHERFEDAVRLARAVSGLLALTMRWLALARSLGTALRAAQEAGDELAAAWAKHELGTLPLAAGNPSASARMLAEARDVRHRLGDRTGLAATDRNLQSLCGQLRQLLREGRLVQTSRLVGRAWRYRAALAAAGGMLLIAGVAAGAAVGGGATGDASSPRGHLSVTTPDLATPPTTKTTPTTTNTTPPTTTPPTTTTTTTTAPSTTTRTTTTTTPTPTTVPSPRRSPIG